MQVCKSFNMLQGAESTDAEKLHKLSTTTLVLKRSSDLSADSKDIGGVLMACCCIALTHVYPHPKSKPLQSHVDPTLLNNCV